MLLDSFVLERNEAVHEFVTGHSQGTVCCASRGLFHCTVGTAELEASQQVASSCVPSVGPRICFRPRKKTCAVCQKLWKLIINRACAVGPALIQLA